jgi:hypothetical protein
MFYFISLLICICVVGLVVYMYLKTSRLEEDLSREQIRNTQHLATIESLEGEKTSFRNQIVILEDHAKSLSKYEGIYDVEQQIKILNDENQRLAQNTVEQAKLQSSEIIEQARLSADSINKIASETIEEANRQKRFLESEGQRKLHEAETQVTKIVGEAYEDYKELRDLKKSLTAIQNTIDGYGDSYIVPSHSFIDVLADQYGYTEYAKELKKIRKEIRELSAKGMAASCDYVEQSRKDTAVRFVTDAFNGKVDSILSEVSDENYGVLSQRVVDSFNLVNLNGKAFRNAVITKSYLDLRITELRLSSTIQHLKSEEREEQKRIREQIREEERARRE